MSKRKAGAVTTKKLYSLTPEHRAQLEPWRDRWIANAMSCEPMNDEDRAVMRGAIAGLHAAAKLTPPRNVVFVSSPMTAALAAGIAAGVWWLRKNPTKHRALFGRTVDDRTVMAAIPAACAFAVRSAKSLLATERPSTRAATFDATDAATDAATFDATSNATRAATRAATSDATDAATDAATRAATRAATFDATSAATSAATFDATDAATDAATRAATFDATDAATSAATSDATSDATSNATSDATSDAISAATSDATSDATSNATRAATDAATRAATRAATSAATFDATFDATDAATDAASSAATSAATSAAISAAISAATISKVAAFLVRSCSGVYRGRNPGNMWSGWVAYLSFFRHVAELGLDYSAFDHYEKATVNAGPRYMFADFCIVSDRPERIHKDEQNRPHRADGPSHRWRDGWELYFWRGTRVPKAWIADKAHVSAAEILSWPNIEQRRAGCEIIGWDRILSELKAKTIDKDTDPEIGELISVDLPDSPGERFLRVQCGTKRTFAIPVPPETKTALEGNAWTFGISAKELMGLEVRT